jgi:hypothetical protein
VACTCIYICSNVVGVGAAANGARSHPDVAPLIDGRLPAPPHSCTFALLACQARPRRLADVDGGCHAPTI